MEAIDIARKAVDVASDKQGGDIVLLDVRGVCSFTDYFVIATGESTRQLRTILEETRKVLKEQGIAEIFTPGTDTRDVVKWIEEIKRFAGE